MYLCSFGVIFMYTVVLTSQTIYGRRLVCCKIVAYCLRPNFAVIHEAEGPTPYSQYEHSSIPATVKKLFNLKSNFLTKRDAWAGTFEKYFHIRDTPRDDCPGLDLLLRYLHYI